MAVSLVSPEEQRRGPKEKERRDPGGHVDQGNPEPPVRRGWTSVPPGVEGGLDENETEGTSVPPG